MHEKARLLWAGLLFFAGITPNLSTHPGRKKSTTAPLQRAAIGAELALFGQVFGADAVHG
ncbi:MAG: hypothetical protein JWP58_622 [Hymenobacter sp.]|nr:hypothetical protein [Hymenobacter sp.]